MRTLLYTTAAILILGSCTSVQKLVDKGEYDEAIYLAADKLAGQKNPKTKHVKALEEAFEKVNALDMDRMAYLKAKNDPAQWDAIFNIALKIEKRQNRISPFVPLISKDGYPAYFNFANVQRMKLEAGEKASDYHYITALSLIEKAKVTQNKLTARKAFDHLESIRRYYHSYREMASLTEEARHLGTTYVLVKLDQTIENAIGIDPNNVRGFYGTIQDKIWVDYRESFDPEVTFDIVTTLYIDAVEISPEREEINRFVETKTIEKWVDQVNRRGEAIKDSLGNVIQVKEKEVLQAKIKEIKRTKNALLSGRAEIRDYHTGNLINKERMDMVVNFYSDHYTFSGDRAALTERVRTKIDRNLEPFPSDWAMTMDAGQKLLYAYEDYVLQQVY